MLLCMPDAKRLDMAIKYSAEPYSTRLIEVRKGFVCPQETIIGLSCFRCGKARTLFIFRLDFSWLGINEWSDCFSLLRPGK